jgi:hypothetical protein
VWKSNSACRNQSCACYNHTTCIHYTWECHIHPHTCQTYSPVCNKHTWHVKSHSPCENRTLRVVINLVCVEMSLVRAEITLVRVVSTLVSALFTRIRVKLLSCEWKPHSARTITLCVLKSHCCVLESHSCHSACRKNTRESHIHTHSACKITLCVSKSYYAETTRVRVEFRLLRV